MAANCCFTLCFPILLVLAHYLSHYHQFGGERNRGYGEVVMQGHAGDKWQNWDLNSDLSCVNVPGFNHYIFPSLYLPVYPWHKIQCLDFMDP